MEIFGNLRAPTGHRLAIEHADEDFRIMTSKVGFEKIKGR